ncbi:MAG: hypothetical protein WCC92_02270 [Candidatus Korobacteraceae bacterium]
MPKRIRNSADVNQAAYQMVRRSTQTEDQPSRQPRITRSEISRVMSAMGRKGGAIGGKRRLVTMTAEQRREAAVKASKARWAKHRKEANG